MGDVCAPALEDCTRPSAALFMMAAIRKQQARSPPEDWDTLTRRNPASAEKEQMTVTHRRGVTWSRGRSQTQRGLGFLFHLRQVQKQANLTCGLGSQAPRGQEDRQGGASGHRDAHFVTGHCAEPLGFWSFSVCMSDFSQEVTF